MKITDDSSLSDAELVATVDRLAQSEREATIALIVHLAEFDRPRLYEPAGFSSLFRYCRSVLRLSEDAIYNRIEAARAARRFPAIVDMLFAGSLSPTTARLLARRLTPENHEELLASASGMGKDEVEELLARWFPQPDVVPAVRKLPHPHGIVVAESPAASEVARSMGATVAGSAGTSTIAAPPTARPLVRPLSPDRYEVRFTATAELRAKLRLAQNLLAHAVPSGDLAQVFDRALTALLTELERRKFAATERPRTGGVQAARSRNIPAAVRRAVAARDGGGCAFVAVDGHRCEERRFLEFHHVVPHAAGGKPTVDNIQLRCRAHNGHEVDVYFGPGRRRPRPAVVADAAIVCGQAAPPSTRPGTSPVGPRGG